jgi:hypothetical protein
MLTLLPPLLAVTPPLLLLPLILLTRQLCARAPQCPIPHWHQTLESVH